ncbi:MAG TPA: DUF3500 domain-containing protein [Longimicrobiaceae bacterium]|nr:DUF3500 domain-containing protein [Longimicrobiaceae bacterium]
MNRCLFPALLIAALWTPTPGVAQNVEDVNHAMAEAATAFLESLNAPRLRVAQLAFEDSARVQWEYIPTYREGLPLAEMTGEQRLRAHALLRTALSGAGYLKAISVMQLEEVLRAIDTSGFARNAEGYMFAVFGDPSSGSPWGWRFEGHHLSLNFTSVRPAEISVTPLFLGSNPAEVRGGMWAGLRVLAEEEDVARRLLESLSPEQRARAIYADAAPSDILSRNDPVARELPVEGLPASGMTSAQRSLLLALIGVYAGTVEASVAAERLAAIREAGIENLHFAWAGSTERGAPHYYRVQGPTTLIEYDNVQNGANHIHSVWRDLRSDFGGDVLRRHYETSAHH